MLTFTSCVRMGSLQPKTISRGSSVKTVSSEFEIETNCRVRLTSFFSFFSSEQYFGSSSHSIPMRAILRAGRVRCRWRTWSVSSTFVLLRFESRTDAFAFFSPRPLFHNPNQRLSIPTSHATTSSDVSLTQSHRLFISLISSQLFSPFAASFSPESTQQRLFCSTQLLLTQHPRNSPTTEGRRLRSRLREGRRSEGDACFQRPRRAHHFLRVGTSLLLNVTTTNFTPSSLIVCSALVPSISNDQPSLSTTNDGMAVDRDLLVAQALPHV